MNRILGLSVLMVPAMVSGAAFSQESGGWGDPIAAPAWALSGFSLRPEGLYKEGAPLDASSLAQEGAGVPGASISTAIGPLAPVSALYAGARGQADRKVYVEVRTGPMFFVNDFNHLSPGIDTEIAFGYYPIKILAFEVFSGFLWGEDTGGTVETRVWAVPIVGNAKVAVPILFFEAYAGAGLGAYFLRAEVEDAAVDACNCDWVLGGNAFVGVNLDLGPVFVGVEGKYILTDSVGTGRGSASLEGFALLAGVGIRF